MTKKKLPGNIIGACFFFFHIQTEGITSTTIGISNAIFSLFLSSKNKESRIRNKLHVVAYVSVLYHLQMQEEKENRQITQNVYSFRGKQMAGNTAA